MKSFLTLLEESVKEAFEKAGYDAELGSVSKSNRPDLCEFQCNGAMAAKKAYGKAPREIAENVVKQLENCTEIKNAEVAGPGFLNFDLSDSFLSSFCRSMAER